MTYQPKSYRKFLATSVAAAMVATVAGPIASVGAESTVQFNDINGVQGWAGDAIAYLIGKGAIEGVGPGKFDPNGELTRGQVAKILAISLDLEIDDAAKASFSDAADHWASKYIAAIQAKKPGVLDGYLDGSFKPNGNITRQELAKIIVTAYDLKLNAAADVNFSDNTAWGKDYVNILASLGVVQGLSKDKFGPGEKVTRAQSVVFVHRTEKEDVRVEVPSLNASVTGVSATNSTTLTLSGSGLSLLKAEDVTVSDNKVKAVNASADGKSATVTLEVELLDGEEVTVKIGEKSFTVTYKIEVKTVAVKEATYDDNTAKQYVKLVVGGQEVTANDLIAAGYTVELSAFEDKNGTDAAEIFDGGVATSENGLLADEITLGDAETATGETFYVGATVSKGSEVLTSELQKITVKNADLATETIESVTLETDGVEKLSKTILLDETAEITEIKVKTDSETEDIEDNTLFSSKSSNPAIATVHGNVITPVAPGKATITVTYGNATKTIEITVADEERELSKAEVINKDSVDYGTKLSSKTITLAGETVYVKLLDQYGDLFTEEDVTAKSSDTSVVTVGALTDDSVPANGIYDLVLTAEDTGSAYITFQDSDENKVSSNTFKVTVTENDAVSTRKLELDYADDAAEKLKDAKINIGDAADDTLVYELVEYTSENVKLGAADLAGATITIAQSGSIVDANVVGGNLEITAAGTKAGTATVTVTYEGKKYSQTVTVVDEPTKISSITLKSIATPTYAKEYTYKDVFTYTASGNDPILKNVTVSPATSQPVRYDVDGNVIYLDKNADGTNNGSDVVLGSLAFTFVEEDGSTENGAIADGVYSIATASGDEGTLIIKVLDADAKVIKSTSVDVDL